MSVLIKSMKHIPKDCPFCPMAHWNKLDRITGCDVVGGKRFVDESDESFWKTNKRPSWCPLVEVPTPHGRLIDVNDLLDDISLEDNDYNRDVNMGEIITLENVDRIPTVIEAEE